MSSMKILTVSLLPLIVAACTSQPQKGPATATAQKNPTAAAVRVHGDLVPGKLVSVLPVPRPTELALLHGSDPLAPAKPFGMETPAEPVVGHDIHRLMQGTDPSSFVMPVDAPSGARVIVRAVDTTVNLTTVHLVDVATGTQLDLARDATSMGINVAHGVAPAAGPQGPIQSAHDFPAPQASGTLTREPGFQPLVTNTRILSFDVPTRPGLVRVAVPPAVAASGIIVELQQPNSHVALSGVADELAHGYGDTVTITCGVQLDSTGVDGATLTGWAELPGHVHGPSITFSSAGGGQYVAHVPLDRTDAGSVGAWGLHLTATGTANGVPFERELEAGFGYFPSHAQMTAVGSAVVERAGDGLVDSVSFDVDVQTLVDDRFSVRGTLTYTDSEGTEHPLAEAQTGQVVPAGTGTITLRFDATSMALARVNGPFNLRDVALVSQGTATTQHRIGRGLDLVTAPIAASEIRFPTVIAARTQDLIDNGDLPRP